MMRAIEEMLGLSARASSLPSCRSACQVADETQWLFIYIDLLRCAMTICKRAGEGSDGIEPPLIGLQLTTLPLSYEPSCYHLPAPDGTNTYSGTSKWLDINAIDGSGHALFLSMVPHIEGRRDTDLMSAYNALLLQNSQN